MNLLPDHPVIRNMERTGTPDGEPEVYPICPICGQTCDTIYKDRENEIVGCDNCVKRSDAWEESSCFPPLD